MPPIQYIINQATKPKLAAEQAWELVERIRTKHWHPDIGYYKNAPTLNGATEYALRQVGNLLRINNTPEQQVHFVREDFIRAYERFTEEDGQQVYLSHQLAAETLAQLETALRDSRK